jgi:hypothetical protein
METIYLLLPSVAAIKLNSAGQSLFLLAALFHSDLLAGHSLYLFD